MRARWTRRRAWTVWLLSSLIVWIVIGALFTVLLKEDAAHIASPTERFDPSGISPAAGTAATPRK